MLMVGFDLGKRKSWVVMKEHRVGKIVFDKKIKTTHEDLIAVFGGVEACKVLIEASTSSEWVARVLERMKHTVIVADTNFPQMYAARSNSLKTDRRDAHALLSALELNAFRTSVRRTDAELEIRAMLAARDRLIRSRTKTINGVRASLQRFGIPDEGKAAKSFSDWVRREHGRVHVVELLEPSLEALDELTKRIATYDALLEAEAMKNVDVARLDGIPGVGRITALAFIYALSHAKRFESADGVAAYLGLVPSIRASGDREFRGGITKRGDRVARTLLHEAALQIMRSKNPSVSQLRDWAHGIAQRRGGKKKGGDNIAKSALARRLARIMFAMLRDGSPFNTHLTASAQAQEEAAE